VAHTTSHTAHGKNITLQLMALKSSIHKILESKAYHLPAPTFENFQSGFRITVYDKKDKVTDMVTDKVTDKVTDNVTDNREFHIIRLIRENSAITTTELAKLLKVTRRTVARDIENLKKRQLIKRLGSDKGGYWNLTENNNE